MNHPETHLVNKSDARPAGNPDECFYCKEPIGGLHKLGCVIRNRSVVVEYTIKVCRMVPDDWSGSMVEFHQNDSSWCCSNLIRELLPLADSEESCLCSNIKAKYVGEATQDDIDHLGVICKDEDHPPKP